MADVYCSMICAQAGSNLTGRGNHGQAAELLDRYGLAASSGDAGEKHRSQLHVSASIRSH